MKIIIHTTKKLHSKLPLDESGYLKPSTPRISLVPSAVEDNPLSGWHANLITLQRHNCVMMVHDSTRFAVFIKNLLKRNFADLDWHFQNAFMNTLFQLGATQQQLDYAATLLAHCHFDADCSRSVQGTMNRMSGDVEHLLWCDNAKLEDVNSYRLGVWLAERPCTVKGVKDCIWPKKAMLQLLSQPTSRSTLQ